MASEDLQLRLPPGEEEEKRFHSFCHAGRHVAPAAAFLGENVLWLFKFYVPRVGFRQPARKIVVK